jgi:hypothetical protein
MQACGEYFSDSQLVRFLVQAAAAPKLPNKTHANRGGSLFSGVFMKMRARPRELASEQVETFGTSKGGAVAESHENLPDAAVHKVRRSESVVGLCYESIGL